MNVSFDVKLQPQDLYRFNIYQTYRGMQGWISIILGILSFVMAVTTWGKTELIYTIMYVVVGLIFWFYIPVTLWLRAQATIRTNTVLAGELHYEVSEDCIRVTQGEEAGELPWDAIYKMISNKNQILIYTTRINAYIIPREQIGDQYDALVELANRKLESYRLRMKKA
jgi:hypothetical protein